MASKIFKIHGDRASGNCGRTKAIDRGLDENIGKTEDGALDGRWNTNFEQLYRILRTDLEMRKGQMKRRGVSSQAEINKRG